MNTKLVAQSEKKELVTFHWPIMEMSIKKISGKNYFLRNLP